MLKKSFFAMAAIVLIALLVNAQVPQLINYQALLLDPATGLPIADGTYTITFSIYNVPSGGSAIWSEIQSVQTKNGLYSALLGSTTPLTPTIFSGPEKYLGIKVGSDPEMTPRKRIVSVAYAIICEEADKLDGKDASAFADTNHQHDDRYYTESELNTSDGNPPNQGSNLTSWDNLKDVPDGFADGIDNIGGGGAWVDDGTVVRLETDTDSVGIGLTLPKAKFHLNGSWILGASDGFSVPGIDGRLYSPSGILYEGGGGNWANHFSAFGGGDIARFGTGSPGQEPDTKVVIKNNGNLGIGIANPASKLHIRFGSSGASSFINDGAIFESNSNGWWIVTTPNTGMGGLMVTDPEDDDEARLYYNHTDNSWHIDGNGTQELFSINSAGTAIMKGIKLTTEPSDGYVLTSDADGVGTWQPASGGLTLPYSGTTSSSSTAFSITTTGTDDAGSFEVDNSSNSSSAIHAATNGIGYAGDFRINNPSSSQHSLHGYTDGSGAAVFGNNSGTGKAGEFRIFNESNSQPALHAETNGTGGAGILAIENESNDNEALVVTTNGTGRAGNFQINNSDSESDALHAATVGLGYAGDFRIYNSFSSQHALHGYTDGSGAAVFGNNSGTGPAGVFHIYDSGNDQSALNGYTQGTGRAGDFSIDNTSNDQPALEGRTNGTGVAIQGYTSGTGRAGDFWIDNTSNDQAALHAKTYGSGAAVFGGNSGTGRAGEFSIFNASNSEPALNALTYGTGVAGRFWIDNSSNNSYALEVYTNGTGNAGTFNINNANSNGTVVSAYTDGTGRAGNFQVDNTSNDQNALEGGTNGGGAAVHGYTSGTGRAGDFWIDNTSNDNHAVHGKTNGSGAAVFGNNSGSGPAGVFHIYDSGNDQSALNGYTQGTGSAGSFSINNTGNGSDALSVSTNGVGKCGNFLIENSSNNDVALQAATNGTGTALLANHTGSSGDIAIFQSGGSNQARIDKTGKGFFNGGTQTGGADLAEALEVVDAVQNYEPGDVLIISTNHDSKFEKSCSEYSTLVAGVYATKPGVLLCDRHIDDRLDDTIPVGIVGIIPTKVSGENGPIQRGDLLVTSNTPGHAMKGTDRDQMLGAIIGKALENFEETGTGMIKVLVNVK